jgi:hypothetical protein
MAEVQRHPFVAWLARADWCGHGALDAASSGDDSLFCGRLASDPVHGDPDAVMVMTVLLASPNRDDPASLLAAARAYAALKSSRERAARRRI